MEKITTVVNLALMLQDTSPDTTPEIKINLGSKELKCAIHEKVNNIKRVVYRGRYDLDKENALDELVHDLETMLKYQQTKKEDI